jgi:hypothetical protein
MVTEENLRNEEIGKLAGNILKDAAGYLFYNSVAGVGLVGSIAYSFREVYNSLYSGSETDLSNLVASGICIGLASVADLRIKFACAQLKENSKRMAKLIGEIHDE